MSKPSKGQLISKQNCRAIISPKKTKVGFLISKFTTSRLVQKRVYLLAKRRYNLFLYSDDLFHSLLYLDPIMVSCVVPLDPFSEIKKLAHVWVKPITGWINLVFWWSFPLSSFFSGTGCIALALMNKVNGTWSIATKKGPKCGFYISLSWVI